MFRAGVVLAAVTGVLAMTGNAAGNEWIKTYGGADLDEAQVIEQTQDGGAIVAGKTHSFDLTHFTPWILKLDKNGDPAWQKIYTEPEYKNEVTAIRQTTDGSYVMAGSTVPSGETSADLWVLKLDEDGNPAWQKRYGGSSTDMAVSIEQTSDGGFIAAGMSLSFTPDKRAMWILKLDQDGEPVWQKTYSETSFQEAHAIHQTSDGGYIVGGRTVPAGETNPDIQVLKLDAAGGVIWQKTFGGDLWEEISSIEQTSDGGYVLAGVTGSHGTSHFDIWVLKLDAEGTPLWQNTYGGVLVDAAACIRQTPDLGYIMAGVTQSFGSGARDMWLVKLDAAGDLTWQKTCGGGSDESALCVEPTPAGGYLATGMTDSFGAGAYDFWVLKLDEHGDVPGCPAEGSSSAVVTETYDAGNSTAVIAADTGVTPEPTNATAVETSALISTVCLYTGPPPKPAPVPALSRWGLAGFAVLLGGAAAAVIRRHRQNP